MTVEIRDAIPTDVDALSRFLSRTWHHTYDAVMGERAVNEITARWHTPSQLAAETNQTGACCLVALDDDLMVGHAFASPTSPGVVMLQRLYIDPSRQRRGIGTDLLNIVMARFPDPQTCCLEVEEQNRQAIRFYQSHGFVITGRTGDCGGDSSHPALIMERRLSPAG